jgi:hypothetical protein
MNKFISKEELASFGIKVVEKDSCCGCIFDTGTRLVSLCISMICEEPEIPSYMFTHDDVSTIEKVLIDYVNSKKAIIENHE